MNNKILFVAPHPDDETLGCGGTILKHKANGDEIYWMIITNISEKDGWNKDTVIRRKEEINKVDKEYGFSKTFKLDFPTTKLDEIPISNIIGEVSKVFNEVKPNTIYVNNRSDIHTDHQIVFKAVMSCTKSFRYPSIKRILMYETLSETEFSPALPEYNFVPNVFVDITQFFENKIEIMKVYKSEIMESPLPRSIDTIKAKCKYLGSRIGCDYAESFCLLFEKL
jgi:N-acetylglucosamine malate deacetylase 1